MGRAAKVQSFFESAMTDFTEQLRIGCLLNGYHPQDFSYFHRGENLVQLK